jgi:dCTP deaminase
MDPQKTMIPPGTLSGREIRALLTAPRVADRLVVTPFLDPKNSIGASSIDVRLGNQFVVFKREQFDILDLKRIRHPNERFERYQERLVRRLRQPFVLHPRQLVIGSTLEYIQLPQGIMCYVIGKSSWGRMGLIIATATKVDPGFRGCISLEIVNEGEIPLVLYPGLPVAQLVLHTCTGPDLYRGSYNCPIGPEFPRFDARKWQFWLPPADEAAQKIRSGRGPRKSERPPESRRSESGSDRGERKVKADVAAVEESVAAGAMTLPGWEEGPDD